MRRIAFILLALLCASGSIAQESAEFARWKREQGREFRQFVSQRDREFAEFLRSHWRAFEAHKALVRDATPKPRKQPRVPDATPPSVIPEPQPVAPRAAPRAQPAPEPEPEPKPASTPEPKAPPVAPDMVRVPVAFYGNKLHFPLPRALARQRLQTITPDTLADQWLAFAGGKFEPLLTALQSRREKLQLPDWALLQLVRKTAHAHIRQAAAADAFAWYLLNQLGYDVRLGYSADRLALLMPADVAVYGSPFFNIDGERYYRIDDGPAEQMNIHADGFPRGDGRLRLRFEKALVTPGASETRQLNFIDHGRISSAQISYDPDWINYLSGHPDIELEHYFRARVFNTTAESLNDFWRQRLRDQPPEEAVNQLLLFVQHSFKYQTDDEQFGRERYLLPSESFHYAAIDCEDRSFLLAWLIKDLLNLPVLGLHYPGHVALAVALPGEPKESMASVEYQGKRYIIADPTYMGAKLGQAMPKFSGVTPKLLAAQ